tara:strand:+ start:1512 stop:2423 length:912 start_codon:yes stop_codon:yes gene_type:complete
MTASTFLRVCLHVIAIACTFFALDRASGFVLQKLVKESGLRFSKLYQGGQNADIVVLGNSRAVNAIFVPELEKQIDHSVFHLGYNGMSTEICEAIFLDYLDYNETPDLVILEITNLTASNDLLKSLKLYAGASDRIRILTERDNPKLNTVCSITNLYRYNCELFLRSLYYIGKTDQAWINSGNIDPEFASIYRPGARDQDKNVYPVSGNNWEALLRIIEICDGIGADLKLVASPYLPGLRDNLISYDMWRDRLISELPNTVMFHDYTQKIRDFRYFADPLHMNQRGSRELLKIMIEDQVFSRH